MREILCQVCLSAITKNITDVKTLTGALVGNKMDVENSLYMID